MKRKRINKLADEIIDNFIPNEDYEEAMSKFYAKNALIQMAERLLNVWHDSNDEQPDGNRMVIAVDQTHGCGSVGLFISINKDHKWAYLEDLKID